MWGHWDCECPVHTPQAPPLPFLSVVVQNSFVAFLEPFEGLRLFLFVGQLADGKALCPVVQRRSFREKPERGAELHPRRVPDPRQQVGVLCLSFGYRILYGISVCP